MKIFLNIIFLTFIFSYGFSQSVIRYDCPIIIPGMDIYNRFAGGMNSPQFNDMDVNLDGINDIVTFDRFGNKLNVFLGGNDKKYHFAPEFNSIFPPITDFMLLVDYNNDGLKDIFAGITSGIEVWKCSKENGKLNFTKLANPYSINNFMTYKSTNGIETKIECLATDVPGIVDIDGDGDIDILSFGSENSIHYYKNLCVENNISPDSFKLVYVDRCWCKFVENPYNEEILLSSVPDRCAEWTNLTSRHAGSSVLIFDEDADGDYDILIGDVGSSKIKYVKNGGTSNEAFCTSKEEYFPSYDIPINLNTFPAVFLLDVDFDDKKDLLISPNTLADEPFPNTIKNVHFYKNISNTDSFKFKFTSNDFLINSMLDFGNRAFPVFYDINKDNLYDLIIGTGPAINNDTFHPSKLLYFKNTGSATEPEFTLENDDFLNLSSISTIDNYNYFTPTFGDIDSDGDDDIIIGNNTGKLIFFENTSNNNIISYGNMLQDYMDLSVNSGSIPQLVDINEDGLLDILISGDRDYYDVLHWYGSIIYFENEGTSDSPNFNKTPTSVNFGNISSENKITHASQTYLSIYEDIDDKLMFSGMENGYINVYRNFKSGLLDSLIPIKKHYENIDVGTSSAPAVADIDGDGFLEMLVGNSRGGLEFWKTDFKVSNGLSITEKISNFSTVIYPNPTVDRLYIDFSENNDEKEIIMVDLLGNIVLKIKTDNTRLEFNTSHLNSGTYLLKFKFVNKQEIIKFIKL